MQHHARGMDQETAVWGSNVKDCFFSCFYCSRSTTREDVLACVKFKNCPSGCPRRPPEPTAPSTHCLSSWGQGSRGRSGWSRTRSCGVSRSTPPCPTLRWCWMCRWWRWVGGPRPWLAASGPGGKKKEEEFYHFRRNTVAVSKFRGCVVWRIWSLSAESFVNHKDQKKVAVNLNSLWPSFFPTLTPARSIMVLNRSNEDQNYI